MIMFVKWVTFSQFAVSNPVQNTGLLSSKFQTGIHT